MTDKPRFIARGFSINGLGSGLNSDIPDEYAIIHMELQGDTWFVVAERVKEYTALEETKVINPEFRCTSYFPIIDGKGEVVKDPLYRCVYSSNHYGNHMDSQVNTWS